MHQTVILDNTRNYVVKYRYDAWGNLLGKQVLVDCIASNHNPFLYKGYFYDEETKWYYLQSRYYIPEFGRFLSIDSTEYLDPYTIGDLNLYAYCANCPIVFCDHSGTVYKDRTGWWVISKFISFMYHDDHLHVKFRGKDYSQYDGNGKKRHGKERYVENLPKYVLEEIKATGKADGYFNKMQFIDFPLSGYLPQKTDRVFSRPKDYYNASPFAIKQENHSIDPIPKIDIERALIFVPQKQSLESGVETFPTGVNKKLLGTIVLIGSIIIIAGIIIITNGAAALAFI